MTARDVAEHNAGVLAAAKSCIERGWFPIALHGVIDLPGGGTACTCSKGAAPDHLGSQGKHPISARWTSQEVPDLALFSRELPTNVGILTGNKSGLFVIDVDTPQGWRDLQAMGELPSTYTVKTGGGGFQLYYRMPPGLDITNRDKALPAGVDVRGNGGMVVAPPSRSGKGPYSAKSDLPVNPARAWLQDALTKPLPKVPKAKPAPQTPAQARPQTHRERKLEASIIDGEVQRLMDLPQPWYEGARWDFTTFEVACQLVELANAQWSHLTVEEAHTMVTENAPCDPYWSEAEAKFASAVQSVGDKERPSPSEGADATDVFSPDYLAPGAGAPPGPTVAARGYYIDKVDGLRVATLARDIRAMGPLAAGRDDIMWSYQDGVWTSDRNVVRVRAAFLLGEDYRRSHGTNAEDVVRAMSPPIACDPVSEVINFRNGLYLWQADLLQPHSPDVLSTVQLSVDWDPDATCPEFDTWLSQVVPADMIELIWELIGYLLYSGNPLHKAVMLMGGGRNGKGTFLRVVNALLGERNVTSVSLHDLVSTRFSTVCLFGKIANIAGDIDGTYLETTATFKAITGQDQISGEHKGRDRFDFTPWAVPVFSANKIPPSVDTTTGYLSRWLVVPFPNDFTGHEDRTLDARLHAKDVLAGVAAKAMPALRRLMARGEFALPKSGQDARDEFGRRVDQVRAWVDECADVDPSHPFVLRTALYGAYKTWAARDGHKPVRAGEFYDRLASIPGCLEHRTAKVGTRGFVGVKVAESAEQWWRQPPQWDGQP